MKWTTDSFKEKLKTISPNIIVLDEYVKSSEKIKCICNICGYQCEATPNKLLMGRNCLKCYRRRRAEQDKITETVFLKRMQENAPNVTVLGKYIGFEEEILCKCNICGYEWITLPKRVSRGIGCSSCAGNLKKSRDEFLSNINCLNESIEILGEYVNNKSKILCKCKLCGNKWESTPYRLQIGQGCPSCAHTGTSFVEQFILHAFKYVSKDVYSRDKSQIGLELDIFVPEFNLAIEPGAWDIHKGKLDRDNEKVIRCNKKGINLVIIYFFCKNDYNDIKLKNNVFWYKEDLALEKNQDKLLELIYKLFAIVGIDKRFTAEQICEIKNVAYIQSRKSSPEDFKLKISKVLPNVEVVGNYKSTKEKVQVKCNVCGYKWYAKPENLINGHGCLSCSGNKKKTTEEFKNELRDINDKIDILGQYESAHSYIECNCKVCGHTWQGIPNSLLKGHGCPNCAIMNKKNMFRMKTDEFVSRLYVINEKILIKGEYQNTHTQIKCECKICGCVFMKRPHDLLQGQGCPWCAGRKKSKNIIYAPE